MDIQTCPRCGRALKDTSPLGQISRLPSVTAAAVWGTALRIGLDHPCTRFMAADFGDGDGGWSSDWPGNSGPADIVTAPPRTATCSWIDAGPDPDAYPDLQPAAPTRR